MTLNSKQKMILNICLLTILAVVIVGGIIWPTLLKIQKITDDTYNLRAILEKKYQQSLNAHLTKNKVEQIKEEVSNFPNFLFRAPNTLALIQKLETIAKTNNISQNINSSNLDKITTSNEVTIDLNVTGKYIDVLNYIHDLESIDYFISIEEIRLTPIGDQNKQTNNLANLNLAIKLYVNK